MNTLVCIKTFNTRIEAEIAKGALEAHGVKTLIMADDEGGAYPYPMQPSSTGVKVLVNPDQAQKALKILR